MLGDRALTGRPTPSLTAHVCNTRGLGLSMHGSRQQSAGIDAQVLAKVSPEAWLGVAWHEGDFAQVGGRLGRLTTAPHGEHQGACLIATLGLPNGMDSSM